MISGFDPWSLPGLTAWLRQIEERLHGGLAVLPDDPSRPERAEEALLERVMRIPGATPVVAQPSRSPASLLGECFGTEHRLDALLIPALTYEVAVVRFPRPWTAELQEWAVFLGRFLQGRTEGRPGPSLLISAAPLDLKVPLAASLPPWHGALRRGDRVIWAEEHLPPTRNGLAGELAVALASALCDARLDLAEALVRAGLSDLADPLAWLARRPEQPFVDCPGCPLSLLHSGKGDRLKNAVWHAQLVSLFPALEEARLALIEEHRRNLRVDEHLRSLGVASIEEIEFGALKHQLSNIVPRHKSDRIALLARIRNNLAHRAAAAPADIMGFISIQ